MKISNINLVYPENPVILSKKTYSLDEVKNKLEKWSFRVETKLYLELYCIAIGII